MSFIFGVLCDGCNKSDVIGTSSPNYEDDVPRNGWSSLYIYSQQTDDKPSSAGQEIHACSMECLEIIANKLKTRVARNVEKSTQELFVFPDNS